MTIDRGTIAAYSAFNMFPAESGDFWDSYPRPRKHYSRSNVFPSALRDSEQRASGTVQYEAAEPQPRPAFATAGHRLSLVNVLRFFGRPLQAMHAGRGAA